MRLYAEYGQDAQLDLVHAILLYGTRDRIRLATVHPPERGQDNGLPLLGEGTPVSRAFLHRLCRDLGKELPVVYLPERIVVHSTRLTAWWESARVRPMFFSLESDGKTLDAALYPHPPLLFAVDDLQLSVWALAENKRPGPDTLLHQAPYWNTYENGSVCHGSMTTPGALDLANLSAWSDAYFGSRFTHSNLGRRLCGHPEGFLGMWRDLAGKKRFPIQYLVRTKATLQQTLCAKPATP